MMIYFRIKTSVCGNYKTEKTPVLHYNGVSRVQTLLEEVPRTGPKRAGLIKRRVS